MDGLTRDYQDFLALLIKHDVRFLVVGGFALAAHGYPRYTKDIDIWVEASEENSVRIIAALDDFGFGSLGLSTADFVEPGAVVQLGYEPARIDLLTSVTGIAFDDAYPRRVTATFGTVVVPIVDQRSLIANKRASGRPQDLADVATLEKAGQS